MVNMVNFMVCVFYRRHYFKLKKKKKENHSYLVGRIWPMSYSLPAPDVISCLNFILQ